MHSTIDYDYPMDVSYEVSLLPHSAFLANISCTFFHLHKRHMLGAFLILGGVLTRSHAAIFLFLLRERVG
jgi:hypothetical protein